MGQTHSITQKRQAIQEIIFWRNNLIRLNSHVLYLNQVPTVFIFLDASNHTLSAQFLKGRREYICFKHFSEYEIKQISTWMELFAIQFALHSFAPMINNKSVHCDLIVTFWPFLLSYSSKEFNSYVVDFKVFTQPHQCFQLGNNKSSLIGSSKFKSQILACSLDFRENKYCNLSTVLF